MKNISFLSVLAMLISLSVRAETTSTCLLSIGACEANGPDALEKRKIVTYHYDGREDFYWGYLFTSRFFYQERWQRKCSTEEKNCAPGSGISGSAIPVTSEPFDSTVEATRQSYLRCEWEKRKLIESEAPCAN